MFKEILDDLETIGVTGEETNKLVGYLAAVSRKARRTFIHPDSIPKRRG